MFTRQQFIDNECTHSEYYSQFVTKEIRSMVAAWIGKKAILESTDPSFSDIPLRRWDNLYEMVYAAIDLKKVMKIGDHLSLGMSTLILKEAASQLRNQQSS